MAPSVECADLFQAVLSPKEDERSLIAAKATIFMGLSSDRIRNAAYLSACERKGLVLSENPRDPKLQSDESFRRICSNLFEILHLPGCAECQLAVYIYRVRVDDGIVGKHLSV